MPLGVSMLKIVLGKKLRKKLGEKSGFTLIELIACLILFGFLSVIVSWGIVDLVKNYMFARENAEMEQQVQLVMTRINLELTSINEIIEIDAAGEWIKYYSPHNISNTGQPNPPNAYKLNLRNANGKGMVLNPGEGVGGGGNTLLNEEFIGNYSGDDRFLTYYSTATGLKGWVVSDGLEKLAYIEILIILKKNDGSEMRYTSVVGVRNSGLALFIKPEL